MGAAVQKNTNHLQLVATGVIVNVCVAYVTKKDLKKPQTATANHTGRTQTLDTTRATAKMGAVRKTHGPYLAQASSVR